MPKLNRRWSLLAALGSVAAVAMAGCLQAGGSAPAPAALPAAAQGHIAWDWTGVIGTGQSLSVGQMASQVASTTQPYNNMKLATGTLPWPIDPNENSLKLVPLTEPAGRRSTSYPSAWPTNLAGETPQSAMANEMTALVRSRFDRDFISIHSAVGENGQGMRYIKKNPDRDPRNINGHAYEASMIETRAITRLAKAAGKTFGVGAIVVTHGESDQANPQYDEMLHQMWQDYNADIPAITGQTQNILLIVSQQNAYNRSPSTLAMWRAGDKYPADIVCSGPKYQYASPDALHLTTEGYRQLGEKYAEVYFERVILGHDWRPLEPTAVRHEGRSLTVQFHVPSAPMTWDASMEQPHAGVAEWKNGKGFEVTSAGNQRVAIESVAIAGDAVVITCAADPGAKARVSYALVGERNLARPFPGFGRWGLLCDSDSLQGAGTKKVQPNYAVAFEMTAP